MTQLEDRTLTDQVTTALKEHFGLSAAVQVHNRFFTRYEAKNGSATTCAQTKRIHVDDYIKRQELAYFRYAYMCMYRRGAVL